MTVTRDDDLFELLDVPLDCEDPETIKTRIRAKRLQWSGMKGQDVLYYESLLSRLPKIEDVLGDPARRRALREEVARFRRQALEARRQDAQEEFDLLVAAGHITPLQRDALLRTHAHPLGPTEADLLRMIGDTVEDEPLPSQGPAPTDSVLMDAIQRNAKLVPGEPGDLYAFLGVPSDAPEGLIKERHEALTKQWRPKPPNDPRKGAAEKCLSFAQTHLLNPDKRASYDAACRIDRCKPFLARLKTALAQDLKAQQVARLIDYGREFSLSREEVLEIIRDEASKLGRSVQVPSDSASEPARETVAGPQPKSAPGPKPQEIAGERLRHDAVRYRQADAYWRMANYFSWRWAVFNGPGIPVFVLWFLLACLVMTANGLRLGTMPGRAFEIDYGMVFALAAAYAAVFTLARMLFSYTARAALAASKAAAMMPKDVTADGLRNLARHALGDTALPQEAAKFLKQTNASIRADPSVPAEYAAKPVGFSRTLAVLALQLFLIGLLVFGAPLYLPYIGTPATPLKTLFEITQH